MKRGPKIRVATCQFAVSGNVRRNGRQIRRQITAAKGLGADLVHFPEVALSGYAATDFPNWDGYDWSALRSETEAILALAARRKVWVVFGSSHPLSGRHLPHNSLYVVNPRGRLVARYDKRFCTDGDLRFYSPGDHFATFDVKGVRCGLLVCYDMRFPELYREYKKRGVQLMLHSFYNARAGGAGIHTIIMPATLQARAATNYMWISANNSSGYYQSWSSLFVLPDGSIEGRLRRHRAGLAVFTVDRSRSYYDAAGGYRDRAMRGILHSGRLVTDARSRRRKAL